MSAPRRRGKRHGSKSSPRRGYPLQSSRLLKPIPDHGSSSTATVAVRPPQPTAAVRPPQPTAVVTAPQATAVVTAPQPTAAVRPPQPTAVVTAPQATAVVRSNPRASPSFDRTLGFLLAAVRVSPPFPIFLFFPIGDVRNPRRRTLGIRFRFHWSTVMCSFGDERR
ncbi:hypothetical protein E3N88_23688 [Mikania micrantha]|uniref:Uncharacterized protein n=1 Tax=Mikania micrantha TaxID=192012 RepID=A0A5N6NG03_9ASTR|nr:hypothetical protein E3N88_23688 [Mikania micrantha]